MCSVSRDEDMVFTISEREAGKKEFFRRRKEQQHMSTNEEPKTCIDCELYDIMAGNLYGVCLKDSYIDGDEDAYLQWMNPQASPCGHFKEMEM